MSRVQLALNVSDLDEAVDFYATLFGTEPAKRHPGYANFAVDSPSLKLVLIEDPSAAGALNHLGVEAFSTGEVAAARARLAAGGVATTTEEDVTCCYARQDKVWADAPDGVPWEVYTVLADSDTPTGDTPTGDTPSGDAVAGASTGDGATGGTCGPGACAVTERPADRPGQASVAGCC